MYIIGVHVVYNIVHILGHMHLVHDATCLESPHKHIGTSIPCIIHVYMQLYMYVQEYTAHAMQYTTYIVGLGRLLVVCSVAMCIGCLCACACVKPATLSDVLFRQQSNKSAWCFSFVLNLDHSLL